MGQAVVSDNGLYVHNTNNHHDDRIVDTTQNIADLQRDAKYLSERLSRGAEYQAAKGSYGVWANERYRSCRKDVVDEINFQRQAGFFKKVWRWFLQR
jgi:uncharacterized short protein YbdD (DUF466 family)